MRQVDSIGVTRISINNFVNTIYLPAQKPILFWDTCALLEIIRFLYRDVEPNMLEAFRNLKHIHSKIINGEIYSVSANVTLNEWDDNIGKICNEISESLQRTTNYHKNAIDIINEIKSTTQISIPLVGQDLEDKLITMAESIVEKTYFLEVDENLSFNALKRVIAKTPPAKKKTEFKDCAIWETMVRLATLLNATGSSLNKVFYTVNTEDFCQSTTRKPFINELITEAISLKFECCRTTGEIKTLFP